MMLTLLNITVGFYVRFPLLPSPARSLKMFCMLGRSVFSSRACGNLSNVENPLSYYCMFVFPLKTASSVKMGLLSQNEESLFLSELTNRPASFMSPPNEGCLPLDINSKLETWEEARLTGEF